MEDSIIDITDDHQAMARLLCPICSASFYSPMAVDRHFDVEHQPGPSTSDSKREKAITIVQDQNASIRRPTLVGLSRTSLNDCSRATAASVANDLKAQMAARKERLQQEYRAGKETSTTQPRNGINGIHIIELDEESSAVLPDQRNGERGLAADFEMARRLHQEINLNMQADIVSLVDDPVTPVKSSGVLFDLDNYLDDEEDVPIVVASPHHAKAKSPSTTVPFRPEKKFAERAALPYVDEPYDLSKPAIQRQILSHENSEPGNSVTFDVLRHIHQNEMEDPKALHFELCVNCAHFSTDSEDFGFSCGYRNTQVIISAMYNFPVLRKRLVEQLGGLYVPSIHTLQCLVERGWRNGWDPIGCKEHKGKLVGGRRWIGPVDLFALFMNLGIECKIVSFTHHHPHKGSHPALFDWMARYFAGSNLTPVLPVYLQHEGHSQTVVGFENRKDPHERRLLVFDPAVSKNDIERKTGNEIRWLEMNVRRSVARLHEPNYEVLLFTGRVLTAEEQERIKAASVKGLAGERFVS